MARDANRSARASSANSAASGERTGDLVRFPVPVEEAGRSPERPSADTSRRSDVDEWGRSERTRRLVRRLAGPCYDHWFRVEWEGLEKVPRCGGALLIANHGGAIPSDAPMIMHGIEKELGRPVYGLADNWFRTLPMIGTAWARSGGVPAHPDNAHRLLHDQGQLALVFPEGSKGPSKLVSERYRLRRFGRGGFVETAMRADVPVVPIAVIGAEESMPIVYRSPAAAKLLRLPYLPITANHLLFGPVLGSLVYLPAKFRLRVLDPVSFAVEPGLGRYPRSQVMEASEAIRKNLQENLYDMVAKRRSIWFG
ncbi:MAG: lysophospholipid acyltransferase family protein [Acidimicrobiales bacterium]